ncbi:MAG: M23 family metallopeptidase [Gemmatimonadaceae bacterium]
MKTAGARAIAWSAVALLAFGALRFLRPLPERRPAEVLLDGASRVLPPDRVDSLAAGETLGAVLGRAGLSSDDVAAALGVSGLDPRRMPAGMRITLGAVQPGDSAPRAITLHLAIDRLLRLIRTDTGWIKREELLPWTVDTLVVRGAITSTLYDAMDSAAVELLAATRTELAWNVADIFEYRLDMSRDLQDGDTFSVLLERKRGPSGAERVGRVLAAEYVSGPRKIDAIRQENGASAKYYDQDGKSMEAAFLRAPLQFRRISSVFGMRKHPILGIWRAHKGTDYSAASGTPVRAIGDGIVVFEGRKSGFGNTLEIRHVNGAVSRYGHLRGFAATIHRGSRVSIGQTVAYVGATGLATAPHLHFEVLVGGVQRNPRTALDYSGGLPLPAADRPGFDVRKAAYLGMIERGASHVADVNSH